MIFFIYVWIWRNRTEGSLGIKPTRHSLALKLRLSSFSLTHSRDVAKRSESQNHQEQSDWFDFGWEFTFRPEPPENKKIIPCG